MKIDVTFDELRDIQDAVFQEQKRWAKIEKRTSCRVARSICEDYSELLEKLLKIES